MRVRRGATGVSAGDASTTDSAMRLLVSNDDGYLAPGLQSLATALTPLGEVIVVAPDRDRSGASNSLTLRTPIRPRTAHNGFIYVDGTPTDCVHLAVTGLLDPEPDIVVSGINAGANLGDDVIYSGTVAAAMEGRVLGLPAIAVSLASSHCEHFDTAARVASRLVERIAGCPLDSNVILNVNVPDVEVGALRGFRATRLGHRHRSEPVIRMTDPRGGTIYWVGPSGAEQDAGPGTDFDAVRAGFVSVTPLHVDLTRHQSLSPAERWLAEVALP